MVKLPDVNDVFADRFRILSPIGQGGMGVVFRALDTTTDQSIALKLLHPRAVHEEQARERFQREIKILRRLDHPNIVHILDDGVFEEFLWFSMDLITGPNLLTFVDAIDPLSLEHAVMFIGQVSSAINHAHDHGIVHRDLKPTNVIIQDSRSAKLLDFGLARDSDDAALTLPGQALGTAAYMAPEVGRGEKAGPEADIYALGCLFFQLVTGLLPYIAESPVDLIYMHQRADIPRLSTYRQGIPPHMEEAVTRALAKDASKRYKSARRFYEALIEEDGMTSAAFPSFEVYSSEARRRPATTMLTEWRLVDSFDIPGAGVLGGWCVECSRDFRKLAVGGDAIEGPLLFDVHTGEWSRLGPHGAGVGVRTLAWSRSGDHLAFANSQRLAIVHMARNKCTARLDVSNHRPWRVDFLPDSPSKPSVVTAGESGGVIVWRSWPDTAPEVFRAHKGICRSLRVSPGGGTYVTGGLDGSLNFWKARNNELRGALKQKDAAFWDVVFSRSGEYLAAASSDKDLPVLVYRSAGGKFEGQRVRCGGRALALAFSASERVLAVGGQGVIAFLELEEDGWNVVETVPVEGEVRGLTFGRGDRTLFAVTSTGQLVALRRGHPSGSKFKAGETLSGAVPPAEPTPAGR